MFSPTSQITGPTTSQACTTSSAALLGNSSNTVVNSQTAKNDVIPSQAQLSSNVSHLMPPQLPSEISGFHQQQSNGILFYMNYFKTIRIFFV